MHISLVELKGVFLLCSRRLWLPFLLFVELAAASEFNPTSRRAAIKGATPEKKLTLLKEYSENAEKEISELESKKRTQAEEDNYMALLFDLAAFRRMPLEEFNSKNCDGLDRRFFEGFTPKDRRVEALPSGVRWIYDEAKSICKTWSK